MSGVPEGSSLAAAGGSGASPGPGILLRMARGFSCIFWGIPLALLMFSGALDLRVTPRLRIPTFVLGLILVFAGILQLNRAPNLTPRWAGRIRHAQVTLLILVYLSPFVYWWRAMPHVAYYGVNMLAIVVTAMGGLLALNRLAEETGRLFGDGMVVIEARLCGGLSVLFLLAPGAVAALRSILAAAPLENSRAWALVLVPYLMPRWMYA
ncbi:MAG: hypothetical protein KA248_13185, partial [Kiritimatiellae bacterium]|nr:hypothetical protein [Kiritimatiellia bacterium]